jgi:hypothetical protein
VQRHAGHDHDAHDQEEPEVQGLFVQRDEGPAEDEEEVLQGSFVQREAADDEPLEDEEAAGG